MAKNVTSVGTASSAGRLGSRLLVCCLAAFMLSACGDSQVFRIFSDESSEPAPTQLDAGNAGADAAAADPMSDQEWYDSQTEIIAPWAHRVDKDVMLDAAIESDRLSWPLDGYEYMVEWQVGDIIWAPLDDANLAVARRVLEVETTDSQVTFYTKDARLPAVYLKSHIEIDSETRGIQWTGEFSADEEEGDYRTQRQEFYASEEDIHHQIGTDTRKYGFCAKASGSGFEACAGARLECPSDYNDNNDICANDRFEPGQNVRQKPLTGDVQWGVSMEFKPRINYNIYKLLAIIDITDMSLFQLEYDADDDICKCIVRNWSDDLERVANYCDHYDDELDAARVSELKADCQGEVAYAKIEIAGGASMELKDFTLKAFQAMNVEKEYVLFQSVPFPLGPTGFTAQFTVNFKPSFQFETSGELHWRNAPNGPRFGFDFGFGFEHDEDNPARFYEVTHGDENSTSLPSPQVDLTGAKVSVATDIGVGLKVAFAAVAGIELKIGAKPEVGVSFGAENLNGTPQTVCQPFAKIGATLGFKVFAGIGLFNWDRSWNLLDTCAKPDDSTVFGNYFGLDMRDYACLDWKGENFCNNLSARYIRLRGTGDPGGTIYSGQRVDPDGIEIDTIYILRGDDQVIRPTSIISGPSTFPLGSVNTATDFDVCNYGDWPDKVGTFRPGEDVVIEFAEPIRPGDKVEIFRQGFPLSQGSRNEDGDTIMCRPSGDFDVYVTDAAGSRGKKVGSMTDYLNNQGVSFDIDPGDF
ncbi:hypothetical protein FIV42_08080 [Persicimonas caeni]|uniref:Uncharacterized protein n=1 Tax=Persicimonas caeni TaxID=2292766 RepID=A0A4Y6PQT2_PERCE|nr:hypothetical protein [Persicimonas caeni]QDG50688.1 hypothetical protein FIV42_08080 [Persicimonas caeni]QED31909.1 hypothetical protein FRD00_08075 [Persicimonas caeni]